MSLVDSIQTSIESGQEVILDFWREGCQPCKGLAMQLDKLSNTNPAIIVYKIDTNSEETQSLVSQYNIRNVPTCILFKNKQQVGRTGAVAASKLADIFLNS